MHLMYVCAHGHALTQPAQLGRTLLAAAPGWVLAG